jgi:histidinol-phosphate aminotransferase
MIEIKNLVRPNIVSLVPFSSARAEFDGVADVLLDANENPNDNGINRYPDPYQRKLKTKISQWKGIAADHIFLGNGSDEIIDYIIRTFCRPKIDRIRYIYPSFGMYKVMADINDVKSVQVQLNANFEFDTNEALANQTENDKVLFLCSPNNPTGNSYDRSQLISCIEDFNGLVVIDEAYIDFSTKESYVSLVQKYDNLIVLQTFSKALGAAGLRIGMAFANTEILSYMTKVKAPYNIGTQTQERALEVLESLEKIKQENQTIIAGRIKLNKELSDISCVEMVHPSDANFLLVKFDNPKEVMIYLREHKIIVRDRSKLPHCEGCLRITVGTAEENQRLIESLKNYDS